MVKPKITEQEARNTPNKHQYLAETKAAAQDAIHSKFFVCLVLISFIQMLVLFIITVVHIQPGLTIKTHWDLIGAADPVGQFEKPWYYVFNFVALPIVFFVINVAVALKLLAARGRQLALCWLWLMVLVGLVVVVLSSAFILKAAAV